MSRFLLFLAAAASIASAEVLPIRIYGTADGLAHNSIQKIVRDARGFLWFCTVEGLSRFDGYQFTNYGVAEGLPHALVNDLLVTRAGGYWVATQDGLVRFDPTGGRAMFTAFRPEGSDRRAAAITALFEGRDGTIWVGTRNGLFSLETCSKTGTARSGWARPTGCTGAPPMPRATPGVTDFRTITSTTCWRIIEAGCGRQRGMAGFSTSSPAPRARRRWSSKHSGSLAGSSSCSRPRTAVSGWRAIGESASFFRRGTRRAVSVSMV